MRSVTRYDTIDHYIVTGYHRVMSKTEILEELPKLTREERGEIRLKLAELDGNDWLDDDDPLTDKEKALLESRLDNLEKHPEESIPWREAEARLKVPYGE